MEENGVTWFLFNNRATASSRLQGYLIHEELDSRGFDSDLFLAPPFATPDVPWSEENLARVADLIRTPTAVFQKMRGRRLRKLIPLLKQRGVTTVYVECDHRPWNETPLLCDRIVVTSQVLYDYYSRRGKHCFLIPDPIEYSIPLNQIRDHHEQRQGHLPIRLVWVGHRSNWRTLDPLRELFREPQLADYELVTISDHPDADIMWSLDTVRGSILSGDIGVIPTGSSLGYEVKSANRVVLFMALGLPVIAGNIPSYQAVIDDGTTGFVCQSRSDWIKAIERLRYSENRLRIARSAYANVVPRFTLERVADMWLEALEPPVDGVSRYESQRSAKDWHYKRRKALLDLDANLHFCRMAAVDRRWLLSLKYLGSAALSARLNSRALGIYFKFLIKATRNANSILAAR